MPTISATNWALAALAALILLLLVWSAVLSLVVRRQVRAEQNLRKALKGEKDILEVIDGLLDEVGQLSKQYDKLKEDNQAHEMVLGKVIRHVGIVRYDAFPEMGGHLSFSTALLDDGGNGLVVSSITGRADSRVYAKPVSDRQSEYNLSKEEEEAIDQAYKEVKA